MIKSIEMGGRTVQFDSSFLWTFIYLNQFRIDPARILMPAIKEIQGVDDEDVGIAVLETLGFSGVSEICWAMARLADKDTPDYTAWVASFVDDFPFMDLVAEVIPEAINSCFATKKSVAPPQKKTTGRTKK